ncbi:hypothetical protein [Sphingomonas profundi]|uniref:hypothetical protein n=1 Tax=Alterirhizorhabdus profundi TaxID=2681549 RepID=UPI0012E8C966|nr:hypothetical protein [Sphingomonas profundi]
MTKTISVLLTEDEADLLLAALDTEREIYLQSARDACADGSHDLAVTLGNAADRVCAFRTRLLREMEGARLRQR